LQQNMERRLTGVTAQIRTRGCHIDGLQYVLAADSPRLYEAIPIKPRTWDLINIVDLPKAIMPELPEVEVIRRGLAPHLPGLAVTRIATGNLKLRKPVPQARLQEWILGTRIIAVDRRAKFLLFRMANSALLVIHLGMTGKLVLVPTETPSRKHDHLCLGLTGGLDLRYNDARRFGFIEVYTPAELQEDPFAHLGPEPFWEEFSATYLLGRARNRNQPVKCFLMDNTVVVGIGNIYASEILFAAGIRPAVRAGDLDKGQWQRIVAASRAVLEKAIACGGTTIADFVNESGKSGYFQNELRVYGRAGRPCLFCHTPVSRAVMSGRATFFCNQCQQ
jgi:formamidopyrimidine-DNA glycosylase